MQLPALDMFLGDIYTNLWLCKPTAMDLARLSETGLAVAVCIPLIFVKNKKSMLIFHVSISPAYFYS